jgi:hypothetical protein
MMKLFRILFLLGALLGLSGCPGEPCFSDSIGMPGPASPGVIMVGEETRTRVSPFVPGACGSENPESPRSLSVEVSGPDNLPVPNEAELGKPPRAAATVTFTADKPGRYHVFAAFEPVGGIQQFEFYAARNRSAEAPLHTMALLCGALERTRRGGWVCDSNFVRDGNIVQRFNGARLAVAGDVVWAVNGSLIQRYVDTGSALQLTATLTAGLSTTDALIASETELLALRTPGVDRIVFDGTEALALKGSAFIPVSSGTVGSTGLRGLLLRSGELLMVITNAPTNSTAQPPNSFTSQACPYQIEPERILRTTDPCQTFTGDVVGYEPGGLWMGTRFSFGEMLADLRWVELTEGKLVEQASLPLGMNFEVVKRPFTLRNTVIPVLISPGSQLQPRFRPTVPVYAPDERGIQLEFLDSEMPQPIASTSLQWGETNSSSLGIRVRVRPTTP